MAVVCLSYCTFICQIRSGLSTTVIREYCIALYCMLCLLHSISTQTNHNNLLIVTPWLGADTIDLLLLRLLLAVTRKPINMSSYGQIPLDGPDRTLSETQVYDKVSHKVRSGPLGSPTSPRTLSGRGHVCSISTCTDFVLVSGRVADKVCGSV